MTLKVYLDLLLNYKDNVINNWRKFVEFAANYFYQSILYLYLRIQNLKRETKIHPPPITSLTDYHFKDSSVFPRIYRTLLQ
jgi:hypothetical protein